MLVVAPLRVCQLVWEQEAKQWTQFRHLKFATLHGPKKKEILQTAKADIYLINPEGVAWLSSEFWGRALPFDIVTIDELTKFKNGQSVRHKAFRPRLKKVKRRWGLTGTPIPNGYLDLFGQMKILDDGASLGTYYSHYREKYFEKDFSGFNYELRRGSAKAIEERIRPYVLRMSADDYMKLPQVVTDIRPVEMPRKARKVYDEMKAEMIAELEDATVEAGNAAAVYSKLKQMGNGAVYVGDGVLEPKRVVELHDAKIEAIVELVEELAGTPVLIAYEFNHDLKRLLKALGKVPHLGAGVDGERARIIERKWNNGEIPVLLAHPASAGHGLNFQKGNACHIAWFSTTWDYELYDQFMRRIVRQGNNAPRVFNHIFIVNNSIDIKTQDVIQEKGLTQSAFFDALNAEIYQEGKSDAPPYGAHSEESTMVKKLSRRRAKVQDDYEEEEETVEEDEEEEEERPSRRRTSRRTSRRAKPEPEEDEEEEEEDEEEKPRSRRSRSSSAKTSTRRKLRGKAAEPEEDEEEEEEDAPPAKRRSRKHFSKAVQERLEDDDDAEEEEEDDAEEEEEEPKPRRRRNARKAKPEPETDEDETEGDDTPPFHPTADTSEGLASVIEQLQKRANAKTVTVDELVNIGHFFAMLSRDLRG